MIDYGFTTELDASFDAVVEETEKHLKQAGFGVLTMIDVQAEFREKLEIDFRPYVILGACNPRLAHKALETEENIGLMLPCNVIVQAHNGNTTIAAIRPTVAMSMIDNAELRHVAEEVEAALKRVVEALQPAEAGG